MSDVDLVEVNPDDEPGQNLQEALRGADETDDNALATSDETDDDSDDDEDEEEVDAPTDDDDEVEVRS